MISLERWFKKNVFWQDVFQLWLQAVNMFNKQPGYIKNIISVSIWNKSCITVAIKSFFINVLYQLCIKLVRNFLSANGAFFDIRYFFFLHTFNLPDVYVMQYYSIISAISSFKIRLCWNQYNKSFVCLNLKNVNIFFTVFKHYSPFKSLCRSLSSWVIASRKYQITFIIRKILSTVIVYYNN